MRSLQGLLCSLTAVFVLLCGCGNNGSSVQPHTVITYAAGAVVYTKGVAITPDTPASSGGAVSFYSVSPALPAGLSLNAGTGVVSGIPTVVSGAASYIVTASGSNGSATTTLSITVNDQAPAALSYATNTATYIVSAPITENFPANTGGTPISYSILPSLPAGLSMSATTGIISGTPTLVTALADYVVTAADTGGTATATLTIAVITAPSTALVAPAGLVYTPGDAVYTVGIPIQENVPTSTGGAPTTYVNSKGVTIPAYSITPSLPLLGGLSISSEPPPPLPPTFGIDATGIISGTPKAAFGPTVYTVTASNPSGSTTATFTLTVNSATTLSGLAYSAPAPVYAAGTQITANNPAISNPGGAQLSYTVSPDLSPIGLSLDTHSGVITGTAVAVSSAIVPPPAVTATYTVTASNGTDTVSVPVTITIYNAPQAVPNMSQSLTPLATTGSSFQFLDTGMVVTDPYDPQVAPVEWLAGQAVSTSISPDNNTLLVLTSGFNRVYQGPFPLFDPLMSNEYVFIFDISNHSPVFNQAVPIPNAYHGIVWDPSGTAFYVSGGMGDAPFGTDPIPYYLPNTLTRANNNGDNVHIITQQGGSWVNAAELDLGQNISNQTVVQGHPSGNGLPVPNNSFASVNAAVYVAPMAAGLAISSDGQTLVVANYFNDSITVFTGGLSAWLSQWVADPASMQGMQGTTQGTELDLRPGKAASGATPGTPGGEYPFWVVMAGSGTGEKAYVSSIRDREIDVVSLYANCPFACAFHPSVTARIAVKGQPNKMTINKAGTLLYVAEDESDTVDVIDLNPQDAGLPTQSQPATQYKVIESIPVIAPPATLSTFSLTPYTGANTNSVTLSPDEKTLYVTNGNLNNIAVVALNGSNRGDQVAGLIPTGWYPNSVSISSDGSWAYAVNSKSPTGPNINWCYVYGPSSYPTCMPANEYNPQLTKAGLLSFPLAGLTAQLPALTTTVAANNHFATVESPAAAAILAAVHGGIQHVIYILKENRTYDQILGDLGRGNGDPALAMFGQAVTPNEHNMAQQFVTLDNFRASAEVSYDG